MRIILLEDLIKLNLKNNNKSIISVMQLTKQKIKKYYSCDNRPFNFSNYSKVINRLYGENLYYEVQTTEGFYLLEYNGIRFGSIELEGNEDINSLKKFQELDELNKIFQDWLDDRYKSRVEAESKARKAEIKFIKFLKERRKQNKNNEKDIEL